MEKDIIKLGQKVICYKKIVRTKNVPYIYYDKNAYQKALKENKESQNYIIYLESNLDDEDFDVNKEVSIKPIEGIVVARKRVPMKAEISFNETDFGDWTNLYKYDYVECYKVFYNLNHSILVPVKSAELVKE